MSQLAFRFRVPKYAAASLGAYAAAGEEFAQKLRRDLPISDGIAFLDVTSSDKALQVDVSTDVKNILNSSTYLHRVSQAGGAAGVTTVSGALATSVILAVFASNDTTHAVTDVTAEWVLPNHPPGAGTFDNTGGSNNTGSHVIFVFYNPPQNETQIGQTL